MLIELLALLVFMSMAYAFVAKDELRLDPWKVKYERVVVELGEAKRTIATLRRELSGLQEENSSLRESLRRFAQNHNQTLPANDELIISKEEFARAMRELANAKALLKERQIENESLRARAAGGGADLPVCTVTPGVIFAIDLLGDGNFLIRPAWAATAADRVVQVDGARAFASAGVVSPGQFATYARRVSEWGHAQRPSCNFRVSVTERHGDLARYKRQLATVEGYFYARRMSPRPAKRP